MTSLYAFCRQVDDVADEESLPVDERRRQLNNWRSDIAAACEGRAVQMEVNCELAPHIYTYSLPFSLFNELILGVEMDLEKTRYSDQTDLELYCYRVASVVGLLSIEIFGYHDPICKEYAVALGKALQLTNILRDVGNDAARGRIYIPEADLAQFKVDPSEILNHRWSERFFQLAKALSTRARSHYQQARILLPSNERKAMLSAELMGNVYWHLLQRLERSRFQVLDVAPIRLSKPRKLTLILSAALRAQLGFPFSDYGC